MSEKVHNCTELGLTVHYILISTKSGKLFIKQTDRQNLWVVITDYIAWTRSSMERKPKYRRIQKFTHLTT